MFDNGDMLCVFVFVLYVCVMSFVLFVFLLLCVVLYVMCLFIKRMYN